MKSAPNVDLKLLIFNELTAVAETYESDKNRLIDLQNAILLTEKRIALLRELIELEDTKSDSRGEVTR